MSAVAVALCYDPRLLGDPRVRRRLGGADLLVFPELLDGGYMALAEGRRPHPITSPLVQTMREISKEAQLTCVAGSIRLLHGTRRPTNSSLIFDRGRFVARYDKIHLFKPTRDPHYFQAGTSITTFRLKCKGAVLQAGVMICFDLRFPEVGRQLLKRGAAILVIPARWPLVRDLAWRTLLQARAIENQAFVIGCNAKGDEGGHSYIFDPTGRLIFSNAGRRNSMVDLCVLEMSALVQSRMLYNARRDAVLLRKQSGNRLR